MTPFVGSATWGVSQEAYVFRQALAMFYKPCLAANRTSISR